MDNYEYNELLKKLQTKIENIQKIIQPEVLKKRVKQIESLEESPEFWSNAKKAGELQKEKNSIKSILEKFYNAKNALDDAKDLLNTKIQEYIKKYRDGKSIQNMAGKNILFVDEGLNTGLTMMGCIKYKKD